MKQSIKERVHALRMTFHSNSIKAFIIPSTDPHLSEYVAPHWMSREWISGFTGSAGTAVILMDKAGLWTDSRYFLQATKELEGSGITLYKEMLPETPSITEFLCQHLKPGESVSIDGKMFSVQQVEQMKEELAAHQLQVDIFGDPLSSIWKNRPAMPDSPAFIYDIKYAGKSCEEKISAIRTELKKKGMKNLIVDLQGNGGGFLTSAIAMADEFLADGQSIVYTEGRRSPRDDAFASKRGQFQKGKLVLLVDESSASASEILSGAIQDWDRGIIVGRRTFGKGLVQRPIPFPDGSMIRLTVARYYTPSGRSIQKPYDKGHEAYERELLDRFNHGELIYTDSIHFPDSLQFQTLKSKRTVYGGGGIMPDIFIPLDTTIYTDFHRDLLAKGVLNQYPVNYLDSHRKELMNKYKKVDQFVEEFAVTDDMLAELLKMGETEKVKYNEEQYRKSKGLIALQIKALIARDMFDTAAYFRVMNPRNPSFVKAMEIINDDLEYNRLLQPKP